MDENFPEGRGIDLDEVLTGPSRRRALIVDDDADTVDLLKMTLRRAGIDVIGAMRGREALQKCAEYRPDVVLLDLMMPEMDGWATFRGLRQLTSAPIIIVSARGEKQDVVLGLEAGVDDYVSKPFYPQEVSARVQAVLRRAGAAGPVRARVFPEERLAIDFDTREVILKDRPLDLSPKEFAVLEVLAKHAPKPVTYEEIGNEVWSESGDKVARRIKYLVHQLRRQIEDDPSNPTLILNRSSYGYQLNVTL